MRYSGEHILKLATAPTGDVVSLSDMKKQLRVDANDEDSLITAYIAAAVDSIDGKAELGKAILTQTWDESFQSPPQDVYLGMLPVASVTSITYYDADNVSQTLSASEYALYTSDDWAFVRCENWPQTYDRPDAIAVRYVAGEAEAAPKIVHAIKLIVAEWFNNREDSSAVNLKQIPRAACHLIGMDRRGWYG